MELFLLKLHFLKMEISLYKLQRMWAAGHRMQERQTSMLKTLMTSKHIAQVKKKGKKNAIIVGLISPTWILSVAAHSLINGDWVETEEQVTSQKTR